MKRTRRRASQLALACWTAATLTACAAQPRPVVMDEAATRIQSADTVEIESVQPRLIREAKQYEIEARRAFAQGDTERARLLAHLSVQRYETARNLIQRDANERLTTVMTEANSKLDQEEARLAQERAELDRFNELSNNFDRLKGELDDTREAQQGAAAQAARALLRARTRQSEAIAAGAPSAAPQEYTRGRGLLEAALEAHERRLHQEASESAEQAIRAFDAALAKAADSDAARRRDAQAAEARREELRSQQESAQSDRNQARTRARRAIDEASRAQAAAIAARMPQQDAPRYEQASFLLQTAERRLAADEHDEAVARADEARTLFLLGSAPRQEANSGVRDAISKAEDARGAALMRGVAPDDQRLIAPDYTLGLAKQARDANDAARAIAKATEAQTAYGALNPAAANVDGSSMGATATVGAGPNGPRRSAPRGDMGRAAEDAIVSLKLQRAEGLGLMRNSTCAGPWAEFEAMLQLAEERLNAGDSQRAFEFAIRAQERVKRCEVATGSAAVAASASGPSREERAEAERNARAERAERDKAAVALQRARAALAIRKLDNPNDLRLREPTLLLTNAEQWFEKQLWAPAEAAASDASNLLKKIDEEDKAARRPAATTQPSQQRPANATQQQAASATRPQDPNALTPEQLANLCQRATNTLLQAEGSQLRAAGMKLSPDAETSYRRGIRLVERSRTLLEAKDCQTSLLLAEEADDSFRALTRGLSGTPSTSNAAQARPGDPAPRPAAQNTAAQQAARQVADPEAAKRRVEQEQDKTRRDALAAETISRARLTRSRVLDKSSSPVFRTADNLLREADARLGQGDPVMSAMLAEQAVGAFASLDKAEAEDGSWRPAYALVIDALTKRDEAKDVSGATDEPPFKRATSNLERARRAWDNGDFPAAGTFAENALKDFEAAINDANLKKSQEQREREAREAQARREADAAAKAKAEKEQKERDAAQAAEREAREKAIAAERERLRAEAADLIREAKVQADLCERNACADRDEAGTVAAKNALASAERELGKEQFGRANSLAQEAKRGFEAALNKPRPFFIPAGVTRVSRVGDLLRLTPKISFSRGTTLAPDVATTIDELAKVLLDNAAIIERVELVGFTDDRGGRDANIKLSKDRAETVRQELIRRGVKDSILTSDGKGPESPVANNNTVAGREQNRRVEVRVTFRAPQD